jgi:4a-hydroxytetrahydrobiopterin dehydratase
MRALIKTLKYDTMDLTSKKCVPCEGGVPPLKNEELKEYLRNINSSWQLTGEKKISRDFLFVNFRHTMEFVNRVAELAENEGHHPVMHVHFGMVGIELWTHAIDGLSENDFIMAAKIDKLF